MEMIYTSSWVEVFFDVILNLVDQPCALVYIMPFVALGLACTDI